MGAKQHHVIHADDLTDADKAILDVLQEGARTKGAIVDRTGLHRNTVGNRLDVLEAGDVLERVHDRTALYELRNDPRRDDTDDEADLRARLQDALEARDDAQARADRLADELEDCRERLDAAESETEADVEAARDALRRALADDVWTPVEDAAHYLGVEDV